MGARVTANSLSHTSPSGGRSGFPVLSLALLLAIAGCLFFIGLGRLPLIEPDEARNAEVAREMLVSGKWITPHYDTLTYLDKPPVFFWTIAGAFRCFGVSARTARLPSAAFGLATVFLIWVVARRMFGERRAFYAGLVFATSPLAFGLARFVIFDMPLVFFESLAIFFMWLSKQRSFNRSLDAAAGAAMGIATLIKGPVGFLIPLLTLIAFQALIGKFKELRKAHWLTGGAAFLAVTLPWFITVSQRHPSFPKYAFWTESWVRYTSGGGMHRTGGLWYYIPVYLVGFFPWSCFLLAGVITRIRNWRELWQDSRRTELYLATWAVVVFVFFSISHSQLPEYFLPALVPLGLLTARVWPRSGDFGSELVPGWLTAGYALMILAGVLIAAAGTFSWPGEKHFLTRKLPSSLVSQLHPALLFGGIILVALGLLGRNAASRWRKGSKAARSLAFAIVALTLPLLTLRWYILIRRYFNAFSSRQLALTIRHSDEHNLPVYGYYYFRTGLPFYLRRPVGLITSSGVELTSNYVLAHYQQDRSAPLQSGEASRTGSAPAMHARGVGAWADARLLITSRGLSKLSRSPPGPFLLLVQNNEIASLMHVTGALSPLWGGWKYSVWEKQAISQQPSAPDKRPQAFGETALDAPVREQTEVSQTLEIPSPAMAAIRLLIADSLFCVRNLRHF